MANSLNSSFIISSGSCTLTLKFHIETVDFDPLVMLLSNQLTPVTIDNFPSPQQSLLLYNPYASDISLQLISNDENLSFINDVIVVKRHEHAAARLKFSPRHVGLFDVGCNFL